MRKEFIEMVLQYIPAPPDARYDIRLELRKKGKNSKGFLLADAKEMATGDPKVYVPQTGDPEHIAYSQFLPSNNGEPLVIEYTTNAGGFINLRHTMLLSWMTAFPREQQKFHNLYRQETVLPDQSLFRVFKDGVLLVPWISPMERVVTQLSQYQDADRRGRSQITAVSGNEFVEYLEQILNRNPPRVYEADAQALQEMRTKQMHGGVMRVRVNAG